MKTEQSVITQPVITAPDSTEHDPYYSRYISLVQTSDILTTLRLQLPETVSLLSPLSEEQAAFRYAPGKWSVKQLLGHVIDSERIFSYRALRIARNDKTPIEGFEQDDYVQYGPFAHCRLRDLLDELGFVRSATLSLFAGLDREASLRRGTANNSAISVRAIAYILAGHELHHRNIFRDKYLPHLPR